MKNIFLLSTINKQHSIIRKHTGLLLVQTPNKDFNGEKFNLFITSDEEIKEGDWFIGDKINLRKCTLNNAGNINYKGGWYSGSTNCKKIILTTDQDLINDGVQAIDDEFLVWFVKNSNCEEVETKIEFIQTPDNLNDGFYYKITVPKMNFYCGDEVDYGEQCSEQCDKCVDATGVDYGFLPIENGSMSESIKKVIIDIMQEDEKLGLYDEQCVEFKHIPYTGKVWEPPIQKTPDDYSTTFDKIDGMIFDLPFDDKIKLWDLIEIYVNEKHEKCYSEKEVRGMLIKFHNEFPNRWEMEKWFKQFKKK